MSDTVEVWTDGACSGNPGPGGWGAILTFNGVEKELSGGEAQTISSMRLLVVWASPAARRRPPTTAWS